MVSSVNCTMSATSDCGAGTPSPFLVPRHPNLQVGDFAFALEGGAITKFYPDRAPTPTSVYRPGVERLIAATVSGSTAPWDISGTRQVTTSDGVKVGTVALVNPGVVVAPGDLSSTPKPTFQAKASCRSRSGPDRGERGARGAAPLQARTWRGVA
jgi:hypothetical protein